MRMSNQLALLVFLFLRSSYSLTCLVFSVHLALICRGFLMLLQLLAFASGQFFLFFFLGNIAM